MIGRNLMLRYFENFYASEKLVFSFSKTSKPGLGFSQGKLETTNILIDWLKLWMISQAT